MAKLREIAAARLKTDWLERWWCQKYNRPRKDPVLREYTPEELMLELLEDEIEKDPMSVYTKDQLEDGPVFKNTGDAVIDQFERDIAAGKTPDIAESLGLDKEKLDKWLKGKSKPYTGTEKTAEPTPEVAEDSWQDKY